MKTIIVLIVSLITISSTCIGSSWAVIPIAIGTPSEGFREVAVPWLKMKAFDKTQLDVTPNPANERVTIKVQLREDEIGAELRFINYTGELLQKQLLTDRYTSLDYITSTLPAGIYLCTVLKNGKVLLKSKVVITH